MRIALLARTTPEHVRGGMEIHALWLATTLSNHGHDVTVVTTAGSSGAPVGPLPVIVIDAPSNRWSRSWRDGTRTAVEALKPDLVVAESTSGGHLTAHWPVVTHLHGNHWNELTSVWTQWRRGRSVRLRHVARRSLQLAVDYARWRPWEIARGHVVALTTREGTIARHLYRVRADRLHIVGNPVDVTMWQPGERSNNTIVFAGRLDPSKGPQFLVSVLPLVRSSAARASVIIAGDGPLAGSLRSEITRLGLDGRVRLVGSLDQSELSILMGAASIACFPSIRRESFSIGLLQALAAGVPVVVSPAAGLADIVRHPMAQRSHLIAEVGRVTQLDARMWADEISDLCDSESGRATLSANATKVAHEFAEPRVFDIIEKIYLRAAERSDRCGR